MLRIYPQCIYAGVEEIKIWMLIAVVYIPKDTVENWEVSRDELLDTALEIQTMHGFTGPDRDLIKIHEYMVRIFTSTIPQWKPLNKKNTMITFTTPCKRP